MLNLALNPTGSRWGWVLSGLILIALHVALLLLSPAFTYGRDILERPTEWAVAALIAAGCVYLAAIFLLRPPTRAGWPWWVWMLAVGLLMRLLMLPSYPILETDFYRYLWDGGLLANGISPYAYAPHDVVQGNAPTPVLALAEASDGVVERVNSPKLRTIYPPIAQAAFALAHWLMPWRIEGLRAAWLPFDAITMLLLVQLLRKVSRSPAWAVVYWWNPLLIKEVYNSAHMELVILPFVTGGLLLTANRWKYSGVGVLALGVGAKVWPVLVLPAVLRQAGMSWRDAAWHLAVFTATAAFISLPLMLSARGDSSGLVAYASYWQMNDALYMVFHALAGQIVPDNAHLLARAASISLLLVWIVWLCRRPAADHRKLCERTLWIVAALFLLSPTQYPWYWLWLLPLLAIRPSPGLLILTATLPLYYLRFPMRELGYSSWFNYGVVWLEFGPAFLLLAWEAWRTRVKGSRKALQVCTHHEN